MCTQRPPTMLPTQSSKLCRPEHERCLQCLAAAPSCCLVPKHCAMSPPPDKPRNTHVNPREHETYTFSPSTSVAAARSRRACTGCSQRVRDAGCALLLPCIPSRSLGAAHIWLPLSSAVQCCCQPTGCHTPLHKSHTLPRTVSAQTANTPSSCWTPDE
jgi:hypothetical protein